jgi:hypothetical protein
MEFVDKPEDKLSAEVQGPRLIARVMHSAQVGTVRPPSQPRPAGNRGDQGILIIARPDPEMRCQACQCGRTQSAYPTPKIAK